MTKEEFYNAIEISEEDKARADKCITSKGLTKHVLIMKKLEKWTSDRIKYTEIASTYRYDKRVRFMLFKYISYLEEFYRAVILDACVNCVHQSFWNNALQTKLAKYNDDLNLALENLDFSSLLSQVRVLPDSIRNLCKLQQNHIKENFYALKELRNAVMHNKFLLLYRGFSECYIEGVDNNKSASLKANVLNLIDFLPIGPREQCIKDINLCKEDRNTSEDTRWELPPQVVITL